MNTLFDFTAPSRRNDACDSCHARKIRCDKRKPQCQACISRKEQCIYGQRFKRGPKGPRKIKSKLTVTDKSPDQIQNISKSNANVQAMLFELQFNKKIVELWKNLHSRIEEGKVLPPPKFSAATEAFIRSPHAVSKLMTEFNETYRLIYIIPNFASSIDFGTKVWQIVTEINMADLLSVINTFETSTLVLILEYVIIFLLGTNLCQYNDIETHFAKLGRFILDTIVYTRDGTSDTLTPELALQLLPALTLMANYYRTSSEAMGAYYGTYTAVYNQLQISSTLTKELEATMICRKICGKMAPEYRERYTKRFQELYDEGVVTPSILYHYNRHMSIVGLRPEGDLREGETASQKAEFYINWHLDQLPPEKRPALEAFYFIRLGVIRMELAFRLGDFNFFQQRAGQVIFAFSKLPSRFKQLVVSYCEYLVKNHKVSTDYSALLTNPGVTPIFKQLPTSPSIPQGEQGAYVGTSDEAGDVDVEEWLDVLERAENSRQGDSGVVVSDLPDSSFIDEVVFLDFVDSYNEAQ